MAELIAVEGCVLTITNGSGNATIQTNPQNYWAVCNKKPYAGPLTVQVSGAVVPPITNPNGQGSASLQPGSQYCKINGLNAVLEGDTVNVPLTGTAGTGSSEHPETATAVVKITSAGQQFVKVT